ncbi:pirin family protein [Marinobacterium sp. AK62]|uniref:Pirin family protein n=1 Tax=Marinobacterium alkalitolerans TaxID=1542925 RepID=A0ABS3Z836_9GAMM|nr:pirin family protein [Marinobacterium alkalitolerans]MBP0047852.1 pirin family protein [Marinobacterium alkalitolerans]
MSQRTIQRRITARESRDGAGVRLLRSLGRSAQHRIDPFLMLDNFFSDNPDDYIAGFPAHPHRGFETVTYMLDGQMRHRDHLGNEAVLGSGGVQWMTAGSGVIHEEMPEQSEGLMRGFQLWVNLPAAEKMTPARYQEFAADEIPVIEAPESGARIKLIAGSVTLDGIEHQGAVKGISRQPLMLDLRLSPHSRITLPISEDKNGFVYLFEGEARLGDEALQVNEAAELGEGSKLTLSTGEQGAAMLILAARPIREPIAQYGPFVMNTMEEVEQAIVDYQRGQLV